MIERKDILSIPYLEKADFSGSFEGMRFRLHMGKEEAQEEGGGEKEGRQVLEVTAWEAPYCYDVTPEEKRLGIEVEFSEKGIQEGIGWLNQIWEAEPERWRNAKGNW